MTFRSLKKSLNFLITFALVQTPIIPTAYAKDVPSTKKGCPLDCDAKASGIVNKWNGQLAAQQGVSTQNDSAARTNSSNLCAAELTALAEKCEKRKSECAQCGADAKKCEKELPGIIDRIKSQSGSCSADGVAAQSTTDSTSAIDGGSPSSPTNSGGGMGGIGDMIGPIAGIGMLGLAAYMMMKDDKKDKDKDKDKALQDNGTIDCSKKDAYKYSGCNPYLEAQCAANPTSSACSQFSARYCGSSASSSSSSSAANPIVTASADDDDSGFDVMGKKDKVPQAPRGEGTGSPYCRHVQAYKYCQTSGRSMCPSCLNLAKMSSPACTQDPTLCIAQNSPAEVEAAKQTCPTDPAFSDPAFLAGGATGGAGSPVVVLPGDSGVIAGGAGSTAPNVIPVAGTGGTAGTGSGVSVQSLRESKATGATSYMGTASAGGAASSGTAYRPSSTGSSRELASASATGSAARLGAGPAPDVQGKYGPSLFAVGSQVIRNRCAAGRFNNCP